jgi:hypothetical protein
MSKRGRSLHCKKREQKISRTTVREMGIEQNEHADDGQPVAVANLADPRSYLSSIERRRRRA